MVPRFNSICQLHCTHWLALVCALRMTAFSKSPCANAGLALCCRREVQAECTLLPCSSGTLMTTEDLMWTPSKVYKTGHIITSTAPATPDVAIMRRQLAGYGEAAAAAASSLLGAADVLDCAPAAAAADEGDLSLPLWARLPSNDRSASCDLEDISGQVLSGLLPQ